ncbi:MAG TPA: hypothetical protein VII82_02510 [Polyangiaceae bacterium]
MRPDGARSLAPLPTSVAWTLGAHGLIALALARSDGLAQPFALVLLVLTGPAILLAIRATRDPSRTWNGAVPLAWTFALASAISLFDLPPGRSIAKDVAYAPFLVLSALTVGLVASYAVDLWGARPVGPRLASVRRWALLALAAALGAWLIRASPAPAIDVWQIHQQGADALVHGRSAYGEGVIASEDTRSHARVIAVYMYPPLNLVLTSAGYALTGETRWAQLAAMLAGGALMWLVAHRASGRAAFADLLVACLLFHPRGLFVLEQAWGEPLALPFLAGFALTVSSGRFRTAAVLAGLLVAMKQHFILYLPALALVPGIGLSGALIALGVAIATYVPFAVATPAGLFAAVVLHHLGNPFREDSLSVTATLARFGWRLPSWVGMVAALATYGALPRIPRTVGALLLASSLTFLVFFALGRQAFCNYYYLLDGTLLVAAAALADRRVPREE